MKTHHYLGLLLAAAVMTAASSSHAVVCGPMECLDAGATNNTPFLVGQAGDFASSVDAAQTANGGATLNAGDMFAHAWTFTLLEPGTIVGTLTNNNTLDEFAINGLSAQLFDTDDLANNIGGTFVVPPGVNNPFTAFVYRNLAAGDYFYKIAGTLAANDGQYASQFEVRPVPVPPAIWLFLSALIGWVSVTRVKRRTTAA